MIGADAFGGVGQRVVLFLGQRARRFAQLLTRDLELRHRGQLAAVETPGVFDKGVIAAGANVGNDLL